MTDPVVRPRSLDEALAVLASAGDRGAPLAGGTWVMRSALRGELPKDVYVGLGGIAELRGISRGNELAIGALTTHTELAETDLGSAAGALADAAAASAFPAIRNVATLGGNLAARPFPEADLVPALLALDARVHLAGPDGGSLLPVSEYVRGPNSRPPGELIAGIVIPVPDGRRSGYERLTLRGGGEYPVAALAVSVDLDAAGVVRAARVALGSVETVARLSEEGAAALVGRPLGAAAAEACGAAAAATARPRDGRDAPGWYRAAVLPALARRAIGRIA
jgi:carbon-monoxide dehydrogenase medium subunit